MKIRCQCGAIYNVPESTCGKNVKCKKCSVTFVCPTPPPQPPSMGLEGKQKKSAATKQNIPGTFATSTTGRSKSSQRTDQQNDAILKKYMSEEKSLEERMRDRRTNSIEEDRVSNSMSFIIVGCLWILGAVVLVFALSGVSSSLGLTGRRGRGWIVGLIYARYWIGPLIALFGVYKVVIGLMSMFRVLDIESQEQLPDRF